MSLLLGCHQEMTDTGKSQKNKIVILYTIFTTRPLKVVLEKEFKFQSTFFLVFLVFIAIALDRQNNCESISII